VPAGTTGLPASSAPIHPVFAEALKTTPDVTMEVKRFLNVMAGEHSRRQLQKMLGRKNADHFRKAYLLSAIEAGVVDMTLPDKKNGRKRWTDSESPDNHPNRRESVRPAIYSQALCEQISGRMRRLSALQPLLARRVFTQKR
jgi:hypothetical protein